MEIINLVALAISVSLGCWLFSVAQENGEVPKLYIFLFSIPAVVVVNYCLIWKFTDIIYVMLFGWDILNQITKEIFFVIILLVLILILMVTQRVIHVYLYKLLQRIKKIRISVHFKNEY
jgi:hypothetical protein